MSEIKSPGLVGSHSLVPGPVSACSLALDKSFFFLVVGAYRVSYGILVTQPGIKPEPPAVKTPES